MMPRFSSSPISRGSSEELSDDGWNQPDTFESLLIEDQSEKDSTDSGVSVVENGPPPAFVKTDLPAEESVGSPEESDNPPDEPNVAAIPDNQSVKHKRGRPPKAAMSKKPRATMESDDVQGRRSGRIIAQARSKEEEALVQPEKDKRQKRATKTKPSQKKPSQPKSTQTGQQSTRKMKSLKGGKASATGPEEEWEVETVLDVRDDATFEQLYLVKWKGYSSKENTWEPKENLGNCQRVIKDFEARRKVPAKKRKYTAK